MAQFRQTQFKQELELMLAEAKANGQRRLRVVSRNLHDRIVKTNDHRMPTACAAMWNLWRQQGSSNDRVIRTTPSGKSSTIEIEFDTI